MKLTLNLELFFTYLSNCSNNDAKKYVWLYSVSNFALQDILCWIRTETVRRKFLVTNLFLQQIISLCVKRYLCSAFLPFLSLSSPLLSSPSLLPPLPKTPSLIEKKSGNTSSFPTWFSLGYDSNLPLCSQGAWQKPRTKNVHTKVESNCTAFPEPSKLLLYFFFFLLCLS